MSQTESVKDAVLYCFDGSEGAKRALERTAKLFPNHRAVVVNVWQSIWNTPMAPTLAGLGAETVEKVDQAAARRSLEVAEEGARLIPGAEARSLKESGRVWRTVLDVADSVNASVIVVGSRGLGALKSTLLGSVSQGLVNHSHRAVMVVPPEDR
ncbi:MAG TPA: universal stress protein [Gaiellales bacterium]|jgi:nucleotide-binding universal stress UspA family protein